MKRSLLDRHHSIDIALPNGKLIQVPLAAINISEEVNSTAVWKDIDSHEHKRRS